MIADSVASIYQPVLLVEDDANDVMLLQRAFKKNNVVNPLQVVRDGEQAIRYLAGQPPYTNRQEHPLPVLILLDLKLPRKSGAEVLQWRRQQPSLQHIPAIILIPSKLSPDISRVDELGAAAYLVKPVSFDALLLLVKNLDLHWLILNEIERPATA